MQEKYFRKTKLYHLKKKENKNVPNVDTGKTKNFMEIHIYLYVIHIGTPGNQTWAWNSTFFSLDYFPSFGYSISPLLFLYFPRKSHKTYSTQNMWNCAYLQKKSRGFVHKVICMLRKLPLIQIFLYIRHFHAYTHINIIYNHT